MTDFHSVKFIRTKIKLAQKHFFRFGILFFRRRAKFCSFLCFQIIHLLQILQIIYNQIENNITYNYTNVNANQTNRKRIVNVIFIKRIVELSVKSWSGNNVTENNFIYIFHTIQYLIFV